MRFSPKSTRPAGGVDAAVEIKNALLQATVPTFAWVHSEAISAGALIAYAHDGIFFSRGGTMGAATPIQMAPGGGPNRWERKL